MWPVAIFLMLVVAFYWGAACLTAWVWFQTIVHLCKCQFTRAAIWFCVGSGMLVWWFDKDIDFDAWLHGSYVIVGVGVIASLLLFMKRHWRSITPACTPPYVSGNLGSKQ
jgi:hypothetical protein